jgi:hypothetical protein
VTDRRATALARYLRGRAAAFSMSADVNDAQGIADSGMALLDAAEIAERMSPSDERLTALSVAGHFESMPDGQARFVETPPLRAVIQRPLAGSAMSGSAVLETLVQTAVNR